MPSTCQPRHWNYPKVDAPISDLKSKSTNRGAETQMALHASGVNTVHCFVTGDIRHSAKITVALSFWVVDPLRSIKNRLLCRNVLGLFFPPNAFKGWLGLGITGCCRRTKGTMLKVSGDAKLIYSRPFSPNSLNPASRFDNILQSL